MITVLNIIFCAAFAIHYTLEYLFLIFKYWNKVAFLEQMKYGCDLFITGFALLMFCLGFLYLRLWILSSLLYPQDELWNSLHEGSVKYVLV